MRDSVREAKAIAIANVLIDTTIGIARVHAEVPDPDVREFLARAVAEVGRVQIAAISCQMTPWRSGRFEVLQPVREGARA